MRQLFTRRRREMLVRQFVSHVCLFRSFVCSVVSLLQLHTMADIQRSAYFRHYESDGKKHYLLCLYFTCLFFFSIILFYFYKYRPYDVCVCVCFICFFFFIGLYLLLCVFAAFFSLMSVVISVLPSKLTSKSCYGDRLSIEKRHSRAHVTAAAQIQYTRQII